MTCTNTKICSGSIPEIRVYPDQKNVLKILICLKHADKLSFDYPRDKFNHSVCTLNLRSDFIGR